MGLLKALLLALRFKTKERPKDRSRYDEGSFIGIILQTKAGMIKRHHDMTEGGLETSPCLT